MNTPFFIAKRFQFYKQGKHRMSRPAVRVAIFGVAIGLAVMIVSVAVVVGFKQEVRNQVIGFGSHIQISSYGGSSSFEQTPIAVHAAFDSTLLAIPGVNYVQNIVQKTAILKTNNDFQGVILKGVDQTYNWQFFKQNLIKGDTLQPSPDDVSNQVIISKSMADLLQLNLGDAIMAYFVEEHVRARKLKVVGIYETNFADYDQLYVLTDLKMLQQLNGWEPNQYSSLELLVDNFDHLDQVSDQVFFTVANHFDEAGQMLQTRTIEQISPLIFDWLNMLDVNAIVILVLMIVVSGFLMISGLLILILERTSDIGTLKALGAGNWTIRRIFLYQSTFLIGQGMLWGNLVGLLLLALQYYFHIIPLDPAIYYVQWVPVSLSVWHWLAINVGSALLSIAMLVGPSYLITRISPVKAIRFD